MKQSAACWMHRLNNRIRPRLLPDRAAYDLIALDDPGSMPTSVGPLTVGARERLRHSDAKGMRCLAT